jgi:hypothetical protein
VNAAQVDGAFFDPTTYDLNWSNWIRALELDIPDNPGTFDTNASERHPPPAMALSPTGPVESVR